MRAPKGDNYWRIQPFVMIIGLKKKKTIVSGRQEKKMTKKIFLEGLPPTRRPESKAGGEE